MSRERIPVPEGLYTPFETRPIHDAELVFHDDTLTPPFELVPQLAIQRRHPRLTAFMFMPHTIPADCGHIQLSHHHGRSIIDRGHTGGLTWKDNFDIPFSCVDLKGSIAADKPQLQFDSSLPYGVRTRGLSEMGDLIEAAKASQFLRANGVQTEAIANVWKIKSFPTKRGQISVEKYKERLLKDTLRPSLLKKLRAGIDISDRNIRRYLEEVEFAVAERHTQVPGRIRDLQVVTDSFGLAFLLQPTFSFLYETAVTEAPLSASSSDDIYTYFTDVLPTHIGTTLAQIHNVKAYHKYPHLQNWTLAGTLIDLDSLCYPGSADWTREECKSAQELDLSNTMLHMRLLFGNGHMGRICHRIQRQIPGTFFLNTIIQSYGKTRHT